MGFLRVGISCGHSLIVDRGLEDKNRITEERTFRKIKRTLTYTQTDTVYSMGGMGNEHLRTEQEEWRKQVIHTIDQNVERAIEKYQKNPVGRVEDLLGLEEIQAQQMSKLNLESVRELEGMQTL